MIWADHHVLLERWNQGRWDEGNMWRAWWRRRMHTAFW